MEEVRRGADVDGDVGEVTNRMTLAGAGRSLLLARLGMKGAALRTSAVTYGRSRRRPLPGPDFVRVRMAKAGICGSDLAALKGTMSASLSPFSSFPAVMGHEGTGTVVEAAGDASRWLGSRVVGDPFLGCAVRGLEPCAACAAGRPCLCTRTTEGRFSAGMIQGVCRDLPGTWAEETFYHVSQLHWVPDGVGDDVAVLVEPLAVSLHAVLATPPPAGSRTFVIGDGPIALLTLAALRLVGHAGEVAVLVRHPTRRPGPAAFGAVAIPEAAGLERIASQFGARTVRALDGTTVLLGGADVVYDAVGSARGLAVALAAVRPGGRICLVGSPGRTSGLDVSSIWAKEVALTGVLGYGSEPAFGGRHTFDVAMELLARGHDLPLADLITDRFPLTEAPAALGLFARRQLTAGKVIFEA